ncbi:glycosyltransferase [Trinickia terrae]|uniref:Glycosyltransferase n=1 Tax=Trinickia terrae TaxID=2571161 RepID=A0A4U1I288_9BURK|nr:glycosyltransferase [Trinickia terrae]TKC87278.1 glycosyltransferase [Trinickia terrae]
MMGFNLIWVVPSLANLGGTEYAAVTFAKLIAADGHRLRFITGPGAHPWWRAQLQQTGAGRIELIGAEDGSPQGLCALGERVHASAPADLIQFMPIEAHCFEWLRRGVPVPVVGWEPTDLSPNCWWLAPELKELIHRLDTLLVFNPEAARHAVSHYQYRGEIHVVPNTVAPVEWEVALAPRQAPVIGCVARLSAEKGLPFLLAAFSLLRARLPAARLAIWGDGEEREALGQLAKMLGVHEQVHFHGAFEPFRAIDEIAASADVFVLSSLFEGAPVALLELIARGRPVVATATAGARWVCGGDYPWLTPVGDTGRLAEALLALLTSASHARAASAQLGERFARSFAPAHSVAALRAAYVATLGSVRPE